MKKIILSAAIIVLASSVYSHARPGDPFTQYACGRNTVAKGDPADKVRAYCGEPTNIQSRAQTYAQYSNKKDYSMVPSGNVIEEWTYNFGPRGGLIQMNFFNGTLKSITDRGTGY